MTVWKDRRVARIAHVSDSYLPSLGGIEAQIAHLAHHQMQAGHDVRIITTTPRQPRERGVSAGLEDGVTVHRIAARVPGGFPIHPRAARHVADILREEPVDVVHLHMGVLAPSTQASMGVVRRAHLPAVVTVHSVWGPATPVFRALDMLVHWSRWPIELAAVSDLAASPIRRISGRPVHILRNGVDVDEWRLAPGEHAALHAVVATRFSPRKRVLPLLEVLRDARAQVPPEVPLRVTIAGEGEELDRARRFLRDNDMGWVALPGRLGRDELKELYRRADVYLAPGVLDAFSVAVQEAQAAGLAILSRSQSGAAELLEDGVHGLLADDDAAMARGLARLATEPDLLARIVQHNRTMPPETAWDAVVQAHDAVYATARRRYAAG